MKLLGFWHQLKKQWKKKLRTRRRWLQLAIVLLAAGLFASWPSLRDSIRRPAWTEPDSTAVWSPSAPSPQQPDEDVRTMIAGMQGQREAFVKKSFVCGEELRRIGMMTASDILKYHRENPALTVSLDGGKVFFVEKVEDLAPQCKNNAYFGLDTKGNLSLFEGVPGSGGESVIRTFFQLNVGHLESSLPRETVKQLYRGIRIRDLADYNSVLSTLSDFAVEETENVMQSGPFP